MQAARNFRAIYEDRADVKPIPTRDSGAGTRTIDLQSAHPVSVDINVLQENRVLTGLEPDHYRQPYNLLRTQILHRFRQQNWNTLAVTSPGSGEGKTLTAINLAISFAREIAYSVLLVDANVRQPGMLELFGLPERMGLGDYLTGEMPVEELLIRPGHYEDLVLLPAGRSLERSAEMLNSPKMEELVRNMKALGDNYFIVFDLPPVLASTETLAFAPQVDASLLVIEDGHTPKQYIESAVERLGSNPIVGTVLNKSRE